MNTTATRAKVLNLRVELGKIEESVRKCESPQFKAALEDVMHKRRQEIERIEINLRSGNGQSVK